MVRIAGAEVHLPTAVLALAAAALGGFAAKLLNLPLPWLFGGLFVTAGAGLAGFRPYGREFGLPTPVRMFFVPVIGVSIGAAFTPGLLGDLGRWWPSLAALLLYLPLAHMIGYAAARRVGHADPPTAFYGTMPGGFVEALILGEKGGADPALLAILQLLRLILCIVMIPIGFSVLTGQTVGSATGAVIGDTGQGLTARDWAILIACGTAGGLAGLRLGLPAGIMTGPILVSSAVHLAGWVEGAPPGWLIALTQLVIGATLGSRFAGQSPAILWQGLKVVVVSVGVTLGVAALFAWALKGPVGESWRAVFLAFAPGGLIEMSLVALSLEISVIYVTAHHVVRIVMTVVWARLVAPRALDQLARRAEPDA